MSTPRGIVPTYVTDDRLVLCKAAPTVQNTYEIGLALYLAAQSHRRFVLATRSEAAIERSLEAHVLKHGGSIAHEPHLRDYSVYLGAAARNGQELEGWVLGDNERLASALATCRSPWLAEQLRVGASFVGPQLNVLRREVAAAELAGTNVDDEPLRAAILELIRRADEAAGMVYVQ
jgi:hypothetical protein